jgi:hypothetical protein
VTAVDPEGAVGGLEPAVTEPAEDDVAAPAEDGQIRVAVAVDVEGIRTGDRRELGDGRRLATEAEDATHRTLVAVQRRGLRTSREVEVVAPVVVAVERRDAATDEEVGAAVVPVDDASGCGLVHVARSLRRP